MSLTVLVVGNQHQRRTLTFLTSEPHVWLVANDDSWHQSTVVVVRRRVYKEVAEFEAYLFVGLFFPGEYVQARRKAFLWHLFVQICKHSLSERYPVVCT